MRRATVLAMLVVAGCGEKDSGVPAPAAGALPGAIPDGPGSPQAALRTYCSAAASGDARAVWMALPKQTREMSIRRWESELADLRAKGRSEQQARAAGIGTTVDALLKMSPEDAAIAELAHDVANPQARAEASDRTIEKAEQRGDLAVVFTVNKSGRRQVFAYRREGGVWSPAPLTPELRAEEDRLNVR